ncbi:MAG: ATP synthase subunit F [Eubacterium sp.]|jgi:V/A-type H+-transporting ATPase subunit F|nr:ATP synthase subunit F [Eubacterium sp.]
MKMYLISDNVDTLTGMRLAGVEGEIAHGPKETKTAVEKVLEDKKLGILLITEKLSFEIPEIIDEIKLNRKRPLVVEIPDRHGSGRQENFITTYINEAIGIKL